MAFYRMRHRIDHSLDDRQATLLAQQSRDVDGDSEFRR
jgi:hypothetical protein